MTTPPRPPPARPRRQQRGIALIIVLGMVVLFFLVAGMCLTAGKTAWAAALRKSRMAILIISLFFLGIA